MVADAFALLELPRKAALNPDLVKAAFQKAAAATHPDAAADEPDRVARTMLFQQLNEAAALLTPAASRLKHLLGLEYAGFSPSRAAAMDEPLVALFTQVGAAVRDAAEWTRRRQAATTFLARAALTASEMQVQEALEAAGRTVREAQDLLQSAMVAVDAARPAGQDQAEILSALAQRAAFLEKWQAQLQAAWAALFGAG